MERALALAAYAAEQDEVPIGAVVVNPENGEIISEAYNLSEHVADASAHAEIHPQGLRKAEMQPPARHGFICNAGALHHVCGGNFFCPHPKPLFRRG